jgi:fructan beta-fructosidase
MNDPNGMVFYKGEYHLHYQYYPNATVWGPMHWGHAISKDLVRWEHQPIAMYPDSLGYIFSGSTIVDTANTSGFKVNENDPLVSLFTYHNKEWEDAGRDDFQYQGMSYSTDRGRSWTKYGAVVKNPGQWDFRDPKVIWHESTQKWIMTIVAGQHAEFYSSPDLKVWEKESEFGHEIGDHSGVWECPDLFPLKVKESDETKWVLLISVQPGNPPMQYFIGEFDGSEFIADSDQKYPKYLDFGWDNYAGVTWANAPISEEEKLYIGWMSNWRYALTIPESGFRSGGMTVPRKISLISRDGQYKLISSPVEQLKTLRSGSNSVKDVQCQDSIRFDNLLKGSNGTFEIEMEIVNYSSDSFGFELSNSLNEKVVFTCDVMKQEISVNRSKSGITSFNDSFRSENSMGYNNFDSMKLRIFYDKTSIEIFINDEEVLTNLVFPNQVYDGFSVFSNNGEINLSEIEVFNLSSSSAN